VSDLNELVHHESAAGVARITLDSPPNRNALSIALLQQLQEALERALRDPETRVIVLTGTGSVFCSGADLREQRDYNERGGRSPVSGMLVDLLTLVQGAAKPIVARINGHARAGGLGLIGAADIVVSVQEATFGFAEVRIGVVPAVIAVTTLPRLTPRAATELLLTGENFDAARAVEIGLINRAVPGAELDVEVDRYVEMLRLGGPEALAIVKEMIARVRALPVHEAFREMVELSAERFASREAQEGMRAFAEKRPPSWAESRA